MDWILFLHVFTIINKALLFLVYYFKRKSAITDKMLAVIILLPVFPILSNYLYYQQYTDIYVPSLLTAQALFGLFGFVYYAYCMEMLGITIKRSPWLLLHLSYPLAMVCLGVVYGLSGAGYRAALTYDYFNDTTSFWVIFFGYVPIFYTMAYVIAAFHVVVKRRRAYKDVFTDLKSLKADYIYEFNLVVLIELVVLLSMFLFFSTAIVELVWLPLLGNLMYFYIVYKSYNSRVVFSEDDLSRYKQRYQPLNDYLDSGPKYANSTLSEAKLTEHADRLRELAKEQAFFLDADLNLNKLAATMQLPSHQLSQVINRRFHRNFFDFVNAYRVEAVKERLLDPKYAHLKLEELAYSSGFNSKASFQRAFKKHTGQTPTEFKAAQPKLSSHVIK